MPQEKSKDAVRVALARAVAGRKVDAKALSAIASRLSRLDYRVRGINPCIYGICLDFFIERPEFDKLVGSLAEAGRIREVRAFPWGIPWPDLYLVRVEQQFDGIPDADSGAARVGLEQEGLRRERS